MPMATKPAKRTPSARLTLFAASRAPVALILRRGPSKWVEAIRWDLRKDAFERGQWFYGRIYEERSDLSPNGELLVYMASQYGSKFGKQVWTGVSRPPWFTPLALWPKDNTYSGGGLFLSDHRLLLNHRPDEAVPQAGREPKGDLRVDLNPKSHAEYVYWRRLERDGWEIRQELVFEHLDGKGRYVTHSPEERVRSTRRWNAVHNPHPSCRGEAVFNSKRISTRGCGERGRIAARATRLARLGLRATFDCALRRSHLGRNPG